MFQFRWLRVGVWDGEPHVQLGQMGPHVLQYRTLKLEDQGELRDVHVWSDWQNVPTATEHGV